METHDCLEQEGCYQTSHDTEASVIVELVNSTGKHPHGLFKVVCFLVSSWWYQVFKGFIALCFRYQSAFGEFVNVSCGTCVWCSLKGL